MLAGLVLPSTTAGLTAYWSSWSYWYGRPTSHQPSPVTMLWWPAGSRCWHLTRPRSCHGQRADRAGWTLAVVSTTVGGPIDAGTSRRTFAAIDDVVLGRILDRARLLVADERIADPALRKQLEDR